MPFLHVTSYSSRSGLHYASTTKNNAALEQNPLRKNSLELSTAEPRTSIKTDPLLTIKPLFSQSALTSYGSILKHRLRRPILENKTFGNGHINAIINNGIMQQLEDSRIICPQGVVRVFYQIATNAVHTWVTGVIKPPRSNSQASDAHQDATLKQSSPGQNPLPRYRLSQPAKFTESNKLPTKRRTFPETTLPFTKRNLSDIDRI
ncbi:hypothetical protein G9A89_002964 [Geosiphon pyriformis]|nr:hypothetical protein G9A89_002964 [Geosiphon pyriformis]